jgi:hypothetical protein
MLAIEDKYERKTLSALMNANSPVVSMDRKHSPWRDLTLIPRVALASRRGELRLALCLFQFKIPSVRQMIDYFRDP